MREDWRGQPARVAVIDDNAFLRTFLQDVLAGEGHQVDVYASAEAFLDDPGFERFELLVTDLVMEGMGGMALLEQLAANHPQIEVIVVTMRTDVDTAVRAMRTGAFDYLTKPVDPEVLRLAAARGIEKRRMLEQNQRLKSNLALALAGQRVLACDSAEQIAEETLAALLKHFGMNAGVVCAGESALSVRNLEAVTAELLLEQAQQSEVGAIEVVTPGAGASTGPGVIGCLGAGEDRLCVQVTHEPGGPVPGDEDLADASFLMQHAHHALVNERCYARARNEAVRDPLTGLYNARYLDETLAQALAGCRFNSTELAVLFIDIDHFKAVNDNHGHLIGSQLLTEMARVLQRCVREGDVVARFGGDEFVVLLGQTGSEGAHAVAERIRATVHRHRFLAREGKSLELSVCVGVASYPEHASDARSLCELADSAMYRGKASGRNKVCMAPVGSVAVDAG